MSLFLQGGWVVGFPTLSHSCHMSFFGGGGWVLKEIWSMSLNNPFFFYPFPKWNQKNRHNSQSWELSAETQSNKADSVQNSYKTRQGKCNLAIAKKVIGLVGLAPTCCLEVTFFQVRWGPCLVSEGQDTTKIGPKWDEKLVLTWHQKGVPDKCINLG